MHLNEAQAIQAIKEAEVHHTAIIKQANVCHATTACDLQQFHRESVLMLECQVRTEEGWDHQAFMEVSGVALWACLPEAHWTLMYPLQLLTGNMPLAAILGDVSYCPAVGLGRWRTNACSLHPKCVRDVQHQKWVQNPGAIHLTQGRKKRRQWN